MSPTSTRATPRGMLRWAEISAIEIGALHSAMIFLRSSASRGAAGHPCGVTLTRVSMGRSTVDARATLRDHVRTYAERRTAVVELVAVDVVIAEGLLCSSARSSGVRTAPAFSTRTAIS